MSQSKDFDPALHVEPAKKDSATGKPNTLETPPKDTDKPAGRLDRPNTDKPAGRLEEA